MGEARPNQPSAERNRGDGNQWSGALRCGLTSSAMDGRRELPETGSDYVVDGQRLECTHNGAGASLPTCTSIAIRRSRCAEIATVGIPLGVWRTLRMGMMVLNLSPEALESAKDSFATLVERVASAMDTGSLSRGDSTEVAQQIWSTIHGAVSLEIAGVHFAADRASSSEAMLDALFVGLS